MRIFIGGDFAPTKENFALFEQGNAEELYGHDLIEYLAGFDYRIFDFETVFEGRGEPITKHGPLITTPASCMPGIDAIHPDLFVLANNHAANLGREGIEHTKEVLANHGISHIGAGSTINEAREPLFVTEGDLTVGFYACAEHEFNAADKTTAGVNPYDPLTTFDEVCEAKRHCDQLIVFYHGGMIEYRYPLPNERRVFHKLIDCGADLVVGQHTHCVGCAESYHGKTAIYGQGDFLFARPTRNEYRYSGLLVAVEASREGISVSYDVRVKPEDTIRLATAEERESVLRDFERRGEELCDEERLAQIYREQLEKKKEFYLERIFGKYGRSLVYAALNKLTHSKYGQNRLKRHFAQLDWLILDNWISCETHREFFIDLIQNEWRSLQ